LEGCKAYPHSPGECPGRSEIDWHKQLRVPPSHLCRLFTGAENVLMKSPVH
jgi:hypothetical protein